MGILLAQREKSTGNVKASFPPPTHGLSRPMSCRLWWSWRHGRQAGWEPGCRETPGKGAEELPLGVKQAIYGEDKS